MSLAGRPAPDFTLEGSFAGELTTVSLSEMRGRWVVLLFYPLDFTFVCSTEVLAFSEDASLFRARNCEVFGVSVDSRVTDVAWVGTDKARGGLGGRLNIPLLADITKSTARDSGVALRGLFLINPEGVVVHETTNFLPVGRSSKEALRMLEAFQLVSEHGDQVCPANWDEGGGTMAATPAGMASFLAAR